MSRRGSLSKRRRRSRSASEIVEARLSSGSDALAECLQAQMRKCEELEKEKEEFKRELRRSLLLLQAAQQENRARQDAEKKLASRVASLQARVVTAVDVARSLPIVEKKKGDDDATAVDAALEKKGDAATAVDAARSAPSAEDAAEKGDGSDGSDAESGSSSDSESSSDER